MSATSNNNAPTPSLRYELFWVVAGMLFSMIGGLLTVKILANILEITQFGEYTLLFSIASFLISVLFTTLGQINLRYVVIAQELGETAKYRAGQTKAFLALVAISIAALIPTSVFVSGSDHSWIPYFLGLLILTFVWGKQISEQFMLMAFRQRREIGISQVFGAIGRPVGVFLAVVLLGPRPEAAILGLGAGFLALLIAQQFFLSRYWRSPPISQMRPQTKAAADSLTLQNYLTYGFTYGLIGLATITVLVSDRWLLSFFGTLEQVAIYAALMQVALAPVAFSHAVLSRLAAPILFSAQNKAGNKVNRKQFTLLLVVWLAISAVVLTGASLLHNPIVTVLTNATFGAYSYLLPWMVFGLLLERTMQVLELKGSILLKTKAYMLTRILLILSVPLFEWLFLRAYGFDWLVMGLVSAAALGVVGTLVINLYVLSRAE